MDKFAFEAGLAQDRNAAPTDKLFGQPQSLMPGPPANFAQPPAANPEGKSKRDLLWEQKRLERMNKKAGAPQPAPAQPQPVFGAPPQAAFNEPPRPDFAKQDLFAPPQNIVNQNQGMFQNAQNDKNIVESVMGKGFDPFLAGPPAQPPVQNQMNFNDPPPFQMKQGLNAPPMRQDLPSQPAGPPSSQGRAETFKAPQQPQFQKAKAFSGNQVQILPNTDVLAEQLKPKAPQNYEQQPVQANLNQQRNAPPIPQLGGNQFGQMPPVGGGQAWNQINQPNNFDQPKPQQQQQQQFQIAQNEPIKFRSDQVNMQPSEQRQRQVNGSPSKRGKQQNIEPELPGGGGLQFGEQEKQAGQNKKGDYLNLWQQQIKEKEENKKRERADKIRREREELQAEMDYNPYGKRGPGAGPAAQSPATQQPNTGQMPQNKVANLEMQNPPMMQQMPQQIFQNPPPGNFGPPQPSYSDQPMPPMPMNQQLQYDQQAFNQPQFNDNQFNPYQNMPPQQPPAPGQQQQQQYGNPFDQPPPQNMNALPPRIPSGRANQRPPPAQQQQQQPNSALQQNKQNQDLGQNQERQLHQREAQKLELQNALKQQMEEQRNKKAIEQRKRKEEEEREEQKLKKEREELEQRFQAEGDSKKKKFADVKQANAKLMQEKQAMGGGVGGGKVQNSPRENKRGVQLPMQNNNELFGPGPRGANPGAGEPQIGQAILPINDGGNDLFGRGPVGQNNGPDPFLAGPRVNADPFLAGPPMQQQPVNLPNFQQQQQQRPPIQNSGPADSPYKPSTSVLLKDQHQLISDLKDNFKNEMHDLKQQMSDQQHMFSEQLDKLQGIQHVHEQSQAASAAEKATAAAEMQRLRQELEGRRQAELQQQQIYQLAVKESLLKDGMSPLAIMQKYESQSRLRNGSAKGEKPGLYEGKQPDIGLNRQHAGSRGSSARPPPHVLAAQNQKFPPQQSNAAIVDLRKPRTGSSLKLQNAAKRPPSNRNEQQLSKLVGSRKSERDGQLNTYEQMFFNGSASMTKSSGRQLSQRGLSGRRDQGQMSAPEFRKAQLPSGQFSQNPVSNNKNNQMVDFSNLGIGVNNYGSQNRQQETPVKSNDKYMSSAAKSMIGHSALVPVGDSAANNIQNPKYENPYETNANNYQQLVNNASLPSLGSTNQLILATEQSELKTQAARSRAPSGRSVRSNIGRGQPQLNIQQNYSQLKGTQVTDGNTFDFIDKMLEQGLPGQSQQQQKPAVSNDISTEFKIPAYEGIQTSLIKNQTQSEMAGTNNGTLNLDALNQRQDNRLAKMQNEVDLLIQQQKQSISTNQNNQPRQQQQQYQQQYQQQPPANNSYQAANQFDKTTNDELKQLDNLLFDILQQDQKGGQPGASSNPYGSQPSSSSNPVLQQISQLRYPSETSQDAQPAQLSRFMSPSLDQIQEDHKGEQSNSYKQADFIQALAKQRQGGTNNDYNFNFGEIPGQWPPLEPAAGAEGTARLRQATQALSLGTRNDLGLTDQLSLNTTDLAL